MGSPLAASLAVLFLCMLNRAITVQSATAVGDSLDGVSLSEGPQTNPNLATREPTFSVSGFVFDDSGRAFRGVQISAGSLNSATTDASGQYTITGLVTGTYVLTPEFASYAFVPVTHVVPVPPDAVGQDFVIVPEAVTHLPLVMRARLLNRAPNVPTAPVPSDGATNQSLSVDLTWVGGDPDEDVVTYDISLEESDTTPDVLVSDDHSDTSYDPGVLNANTQYYWQIIATDEHGATATGPVWRFETGELQPTGWLSYVNTYRAMAGLPAVSENATWSDGCWLHARYIVKNDVLEHDEDPANAWYSPAGQAAAKSSNLMATTDANPSDESAIDGWMQAPFHAVGIIDPALSQVGFGSYREVDGGFEMAAALDVIRGLDSIPPIVTFPIQWPADGMSVPLTSHFGEFPSPLTSCPGYSVPSGLPIILQVGSGGLTPSVTDHSFMQGNTPLDHCVFDETSYINADTSYQSLGRAILNSRDAIVLIPRQPLTPGATYTASITVDGQRHTWSYTVSNAVLNTAPLYVR